MGWGEEDRRDDMLFSHIIPGVHAIYVTLLVILTSITWLRWALPAFSSAKLGYYFSFSILYSLEACYPEKVGRNSVPPPGWGEILLKGEFLPSLPFIYLFRHLFRPVWTHRCLLTTLGYKPIMLFI